MMLKNLHVVTTFDTEDKILKFDCIESNNESDVLGDSPMKIIEFEISEFIGDDTDRAKLIIGDLVLGLFNNMVEGGIGIKVNSQETEAELKAEQCLNDFAEKGDASAKHSLGMTYFHKSYKLKYINYLDDAEYWFK